MLDEKAFEKAKRGYELGMAHSHDDCLRAAITAYLANLPGKPVVWRWKQKGRTDADAWLYSFGRPQLSDDLYVTEPLYTHPLPAVTDEAVERAAKHITKWLG